MAIDLSLLLERAFFAEEVRNATEAIERARDGFSAANRTAGLSLEFVVPASPDERWVRERLLRPIVYYCESEGIPLPRGAGVFVSLFVEDRLYCVAVRDVLAWAGMKLGISLEELDACYGTHEIGTALR